MGQNQSHSHIDERYTCQRYRPVLYQQLYSHYKDNQYTHENSIIRECYIFYEPIKDRYIEVYRVNNDFNNLQLNLDDTYVFLNNNEYAHFPVIQQQSDKCRVHRFDENQFTTKPENLHVIKEMYGEDILNNIISEFFESGHSWISGNLRQNNLDILNYQNQMFSIITRILSNQRQKDFILITTQSSFIQMTYQYLNKISKTFLLTSYMQRPTQLNIKRLPLAHDFEFPRFETNFEEVKTKLKRDVSKLQRNDPYYADKLQHIMQQVQNLNENITKLTFNDETYKVSQDIIGQGGFGKVLSIYKYDIEHETKEDEYDNVQEQEHNYEKKMQIQENEQQDYVLKMQYSHVNLGDFSYEMRITKLIRDAIARFSESESNSEVRLSDETKLDEIFALPVAFGTWNNQKAFGLLIPKYTYDLKNFLYHERNFIANCSFNSKFLLFKAFIRHIPFALHILSDVGVGHSDLKTDNILVKFDAGILGSQTEINTIKYAISDFGCSGFTGDQIKCGCCVSNTRKIEPIFDYLGFIRIVHSITVIFLYTNAIDQRLQQKYVKIFGDFYDEFYGIFEICRKSSSCYQDFQDFYNTRTRNILCIYCDILPENDPYSFHLFYLMYQLFEFLNLHSDNIYEELNNKIIQGNFSYQGLYLYFEKENMKPYKNERQEFFNDFKNQNQELIQQIRNSPYHVHQNVHQNDRKRKRNK